MKLNLKKSSKYLFSFLPLLAILSLMPVELKSKKDHTTIKKNKLQDGGTLSLPCGFPNKGIVSGETPTFYTSGNVPMLYNVGSAVVNQHPDWRSSVTVGNNQLVLQSDGNLVIFENGVNCWDSGTGSAANSMSTFSLYFQTDGNLVLYKGSGTSIVMWAANIYSSCANSSYAYLTFQSDGNLVLRYPHNYTGVFYSTEVNVDSYALGDTNTASGHHNSNHKLQ